MTWLALVLCTAVAFCAGVITGVVAACIVAQQAGKRVLEYGETLRRDAEEAHRAQRVGAMLRRRTARNESIRGWN